LEALHDAFTAALPTSTIDAYKIAKSVADAHLDLTRSHGYSLVVEALTARVRQWAKRWAATGSSAQEQFVLPLKLRHVLDDLPPAVWVPGKSDQDDGNYRTFNGKNPAKVHELRAAVEALDRQIKADTQKYNALKEVLDFCDARKARPNARVIDVLKKGTE
jgi:hypothetical protein